MTRYLTLACFGALFVILACWFARVATAPSTESTVRRIASRLFCIVWTGSVAVLNLQQLT